MAYFITILVFIGFLILLTLVHELGHFTVAKVSKAKVAEFSIGFGPKIFQFKIGDTTYSIR
jgi:regulator of sigma E protease